MPEDRERLGLGYLNHQAYNARLYQVSDQVTDTALLGANFVLWSGGSAGIPVRLISVRVSSTVATPVLFGTILADPSIGAGNVASNLYLVGKAPQAYNEAAAVAALTPAKMLGQPNLPANSTQELLSPAVIFMPPGTGVLVSIAAAALVASVTWLWAEIPAEDQDNP